MKPPNYANRRFIRIQALNDLYSFHVLRNANYDLCVGNIKAHFTYNALADPPQDKKKLETQCKQALNSFEGLVSRTKDLSKENYDNSIFSTVINAYHTYKASNFTDFQGIKKSLDKIETDVNQICLCIFQLLLEWKKLSNKEKLSITNKQEQIAFFTKLDSNKILEKIGFDKNFQETVKKYNIDWKKNLYLVEDWFDTVKTKSEVIIQYNQIDDESLFLEGILTHTILKSTFIIDSFEKEHFLCYNVTHLLKETILRILKFYINYSERGNKDLQTCLFSMDIQNTKFHANLLDKLIEKESEIETILEARLKNWILERVVFLDKIIAKLAICEILYFVEIPRTVSINEYIEIAKMYGNLQSGRFINGILDTVQKEV